jgi:hypothetical protein
MDEPNGSGEEPLCTLGFRDFGLERRSRQRSQYF